MQCQWAQDNLREREEVKMETKSSYASREESFEIENPEVTVKAISGSVKIIESEDGKCHVEVSAKSENSKALADLVDISSNKKSLSVQVGRKNGGLRDLLSGRLTDFDITIKLPKQSMLKVNTVSADIEVNQTLESVEAKSVSGDIAVLQNPTTACVLKTVSGEITAHTFSACQYSLKSISVDISVHIAPGLEVDVDGKSISGDLESEISLSSISDSPRKKL